MAFQDYLNTTKRDPKNIMWQSSIDIQQTYIDSIVPSSDENITSQNATTIANLQSIIDGLTIRQSRNSQHFLFVDPQSSSLEDIDSRFNQTYRIEMANYVDQRSRSELEYFLNCYDMCANDTDKEHWIKTSLGITP